ncbi:hypothetical protein BCD64_22535 [Nostoc sp. MBR 210]|nr:hypothetical protein BCD64_22535 [Nostoc sp. MBR 210]
MHINNKASPLIRQFPDLSFRYFWQMANKEYCTLILGTVIYEVTTQVSQTSLKKLLFCQLIYLKNVNLSWHHKYHLLSCKRDFKLG